MNQWNGSIQRVSKEWDYLNGSRPAGRTWGWYCTSGTVSRWIKNSLPFLTQMHCSPWTPLCIDTSQWKSNNTFNISIGIILCLSLVRRVCVFAESTKLHPYAMKNNTNCIQANCLLETIELNFEGPQFHPSYSISLYFMQL